MWVETSSVRFPWHQVGIFILTGHELTGTMGPGSIENVWTICIRTVPGSAYPEGSDCVPWGSSPVGVSFYEGTAGEGGCSARLGWCLSLVCRWPVGLGLGRWACLVFAFASVPALSALSCLPYPPFVHGSSSLCVRRRVGPDRLVERLGGRGLCLVPVHAVGAHQELDLFETNPMISNGCWPARILD